jgi:hypothetical protein
VKGITITSSACSLTTCRLLSLAVLRFYKEPFFYFYFIQPRAIFPQFFLEPVNWRRNGARQEFLFLFFTPSALGRRNRKANEFQSQIGGNCDWNSLAEFPWLFYALGQVFKLHIQYSRFFGKGQIYNLK